MNNIGHWYGRGGMCLGGSDNIFLQVDLIPAYEQFLLTLHRRICYIVLNLQLAFSDMITMFSSLEGMTRSRAFNVFNNLLYREIDNE